MSTHADVPVKSIARMAELLQTLQLLDGAGVSELARELDVSKSTAYNHLKSLQEYGYVVQEDDAYYVGLGLLDHGEYARERQVGYQLIRQKVREVAEETGELCQYLVEEHGLGIFIVRESGDHAVETSTRIGNRVYLNHVTAGKTLLAYLSDDRVAEIIDQHGLPGKTEHTITSIEGLEAELEAIRERRYAIDRDEHLEGLYAIGVPIRDATGHPIGAMSVAGPANRINREQRAEEIAQVLLEKANETELTIKHSSV
ncbi:IclR family transcriptional regulator [Haloferax sp. S1W]|uniref:IclR family transcriptional regulator n=1 Tax=Haloferax sp. S1W TaxID=3377110 RepID=UPI0037C8988D